MKQYFKILMQCLLFKEIKESDLDGFLNCLSVQIKKYPANDYVFLSGDTVNSVGIVLDGQLEILKENLLGNRYIVSILQPSNLFGEGIVCSFHRISPVSVKAQTDCTILTIPYQKIISSCSNVCKFHIQMIYNMMSILGEKNQLLSRNIDLLMLKGMREKLATYLLYQAQNSATEYFTLPLTQTQLADYLNVSRTSMCRELKRMKEEGLIDYYRNEFKIVSYDLIRCCLHGG